MGTIRRGKCRGERGRRPRAGRAVGVGGAIVAAAVGLGCTESGSCGGPGQLDGTYVSSDPDVTMTVLECDGEVTGSLTISGAAYTVEGTRSDDTFAWSTDSADLCARFGYRRTLTSPTTSPFVVEADGDRFSGSFRMRDRSCTTGRAFTRGFTTTFDRI